MQDGRDFYDHISTKNPIGRFLMGAYLKHFDKMLAEITDDKTNTYKIIDIGCGKGALTNRVHNILEDAFIVGTDINYSKIIFAKSKYPLEFMASDGYALPFKDDAFDLAICTEALEHVTRPDSFLDEIKRVSEEVLITVPREPLWTIKNILQGHYISNKGHTPEHINLWGEKEFEDFLGAHYEDFGIESTYIWIMAHAKKYADD